MLTHGFLEWMTKSMVVVFPYVERKEEAQESEDKIMSLDLGQISPEVLDKHLSRCVL